MEWFVVALGFALILGGGYDVFHTLLNPSGRGTLSRVVFSVAWRATRGTRRWGLAVGPASVVLVVAIWAGLQVVGWALVYLPSIPEGFAYTPDVNPVLLIPFWEALYFSGATLTTLGFGDTVPSVPWLRVLAPVEALAGFALLSASATWFVQLHSALARRRSLALRVSQLEEAGFVEDLAASLPPPSALRPAAAVIIESVAEQIAVARVDYLQSPETYYFRDLDSRASLSAALHSAWRIAEAAVTASDHEVRTSGRILTSALDDLAQYMNDAFLGGRRQASATVPEVFERYAEDHRHEVRRSTRRD